MSAHDTSWRAGQRLAYLEGLARAASLSFHEAAARGDVERMCAASAKLRKIRDMAETERKWPWIEHGALGRQLVGE